MQVVSRCALPATGFVWQAGSGAWTFTVVCKATFALVPGESRLAPMQRPIAWEDSLWDDDPRRSLNDATDLVPCKARPEVLVLGHAFSPGGRPARRVRVRVAVGQVDKVAEVIGDRFFDREGALSEPAPFERMPLSWERAAGGPGTSNPVGVRIGEDARADARGRVIVPNIVPAGSRLSSRRDAVEPVGFGPIAPSWPSRAARIARIGAWDIAAWRDRPLPADVDPASFNAAPSDQALAEIAEDERITLEGLHPEHGALVTRLAGEHPRAHASFEGGPSSAVPLRADTLVIDTDAQTATITYRGHVRLDHAAREGWIVVTLPEADPPDLDTRPVRIKTRPMPVDEQTGDPPELGGTQPVRIKARAAEKATDAGELASSFGPSWLGDEAPAAPISRSEGPGVALPFRRSEGAKIGGMALGRSARLKPANEDADEITTDTGPFPAARTGAVLAAQSGAFPVGSARFIDPEETADAAPDGLSSTSVSDSFDAADTPLFHTGPVDIAPPTLHIEPVDIAPPPLFTGSLDIAPPTLHIGPGDIAPPPLLVEPPSIAAPEIPAPAPSAEVAPAPAVDAAPKRAKTMDDLPLERCAAIDASIARRPANRGAILEAAQLAAGEWAEIFAAWEKEIRADVKRGRMARLQAYDAAYVAQLEKERGALSADDYARIAIGLERGNAPAALQRLDLPAEAMMRIQRTWIAKISRDAALGAAVRSATDRARAE